MLARLARLQAVLAGVVVGVCLLRCLLFSGHRRVNETLLRQLCGCYLLLVVLKSLFALFLDEVQDGLTHLVGTENLDEVLQRQFQLVHT